MSFMRFVQKVLSLSQNDEPELNIFIVAAHFYFLYKQKN